MTAELRITFAPAAPDALSLHVAGTSLPPAGQFYPRKVLNLPPDTVERFRRRDLNKAEVAQVVDQINTWLLDAQLRTLIGACLQPLNGGAVGAPSVAGLANDKRLRLVFVIPDETRECVANLPLELLWHDTPNRPLVLRPDVASMTYLLSKASALADAPGSRAWPLKILIVRSNPPDLGGLVPEVLGLRSHILNSAHGYGVGMVQVDVISSEAGIDRPATWQLLRDHLKLTDDYNVLVYLGHGELTPSSHGEQPIGQLYMESEDGAGHQPISAPMIARLLAIYPIPVVVLAGCMTATQADGRISGGDQGVAQALINSSEAGVQVAVGMRMELETAAATAFLKAFFTSLLSQESAGDIDRAVWSARNELYLNGPHPPQWAAPAVFRANVREPFIDFLTKKSGFLVTAEMNKYRDIRSKLWPLLPQQSASQPPSELFSELKTQLGEIESLLVAEARKQGPLLLPQLTTIEANSSGTIPLMLVGPLNVSLLRGRLTIGSEGIQPRSIALSKSVRDAGFRTMVDPDEPCVFELLPRNPVQNGGALTVPDGELLRLEISVGALQPGLYPVTLTVDTISPEAIVWSGDSVVVVPRP